MLAPFTDDYYRAFCRDLADLCLKYGVNLSSGDPCDEGYDTPYGASPVFVTAPLGPHPRQGSEFEITSDAFPEIVG